MEAKNSDKFSTINLNNNKATSTELKLDDRLALGHIKYAQGLGASLRYANELRAVQQGAGRLPFLKSSHLHEDVLRGKLGAGNGFNFEQEETATSRLAFL